MLIALFELKRSIEIIKFTGENRCVGLNKIKNPFHNPLQDRSKDLSCIRTLVRFTTTHSTPKR